MEFNKVTPEFLERVEAALDQIRPYLQADGGDVKVLEVTPEMVLKIEMVGACGTCPMSAMTLKGGVEHSILKAIPEIKAVEAVNTVPAE